MIVRFADLMVNIPMSVVSEVASTSERMASMGLRLLFSISQILFFSGSSFLFFVFFEEFDGVFRIDDDLSASLLDGWGKEGLFVALGCEVAAVEEFFYAFDAIDETSLLWRGCWISSEECVDEFCEVRY